MSFGFPGQPQITPPPSAPQAPPPPPKFEPKYMDPPVITNPWGGSETLNPVYFATKETAEQVRDLLHGLSVYSLPLSFGGGYTLSFPIEVFYVRFQSKWAGSSEQNAGLLADLIVRQGVDGAKGILKREGIFII